MYLNDFLAKIETVVSHRPKKSGGDYSCRCPAHDDTNPSLSVSEGTNGKILLKCYAGCSTEEICRAMGLSVSDLFPPKEAQQSTGSNRIEYIYTDENGKPLYKKVRTWDKKFYILSRSENGSWEKGIQGSRRVLYRFEEVLAAKARSDRIWLVEGEKDADRLRKEGLVATTPIEGAGSGLRNEYVDQLAGANIALLYDEDKAGYQRRDQWINLLKDKAESVRVMKLPGLTYQKKSGHDVSDWLKMGHTIQELLQLAQEKEPLRKTDKDKTSGLVAVELQDFLTRDIPPREMILDPIIPSQGISMLYSKRGAGKTFLSLALGYAVATGTDILRWKSPTPTKVLYIDGEMPASMMQDRLNQLVKGNSAQLPDPSYFRIVTPDLQESGIPDISTAAGQQMLETVIEDARLLILDNLSTLTPSLQENDADSWAPLQTWVLKMRRQGISVLLVHHAGKRGQQRGTSRREDVLDTVVVLKKPENHSAKDGATFEVNFEKARGFCGEDAEPFTASLETSAEGFLTWGMNNIKCDLYDEVIEGVLDGKSYRTLAEDLKISKSKVEGIVKKAREKGDLPTEEK